MTRAAVDGLIEGLIAIDPDGAARTLERLEPGATAAWLHELQQRHRNGDDDALDIARCADLLARMEAAIAAATIERVQALHAGDAAAILSALPSTAVAKLLRAASAGTTQAVLAALPRELAAAVRTLLAHPAHSAATLMDPHPASVLGDATASATLDTIRAQPDRFKHYVYVVERTGRLVGVTRVVDLLAAAPEARIDQLMRTPVVRISAAEPEVAVLAHPGWQRFRSLPVVDRDDRLLGVIRDDDMRATQQRLSAAHTTSPMSLTLSFAELCWAGLAGITEGVATMALATASTRAADRSPEAGR
ncbi:MAG: CBS domain-containing protein [Kofleriaceae bacterium]